MNISFASDWIALFARRGYLGPVPFLTESECVLLRNYVRHGELAQPMSWPKGLAARDPLVYGIATRPELLGWLSQLLGSHVYLWGASLIAKQPGEAHPWHTDIETSVPTGKFVSVWIGIENTSSRSALQHIAGSHLIGKPLQQVAHECGIDRAARTAERALALARSFRPDAALVESDVKDGDAILFDGRIWHGSLNSEGNTRRALLLQYAAADQEVRVPDKTLDWPFTFRRDPPPAITVLGRARGYPNLVDPPQGKRLNQVVVAPIAPVSDGKPWTYRPLMHGRAASVGSLGAHYSLLQPGHSPHPPHVHVEEEILIIVDGEADVVLPDSGDDPAPVIRRLRPGDFTYYPAYRRHTIRNAGAGPVIYLMLKWRGTPLGTTGHVPPGVFVDKGQVSEPSQHFQTRLVFEGATHFLKKLHAHRTVLLPGGGYQAHADPYDVMVVLLEGTVRTMGRTLPAPAFIYHPAGSLHGIRALGDSRAKYLVIEMHGAANNEPRGRERSPVEWSTADEFTALPGRSWTAWRVT